MRLNTIKILGIDITTDDKQFILEEIQKYPKKSLVIVTPNPEQIVLAKQDNNFARILNQADIAIPDGVGVAIAAGVTRIPGVEFMEDLVQIAAKRGDTIGLIGGYDGLAVKALECLSRRTSGLRGWALEPEQAGLSEIVQKIRATKTRMVFVGLGAPKQEEYIEKLCSKFKVQSIFMSVGGSFDIIAGRVKRAPVLIRSIGFEWIWRLLQEPWRWRRQLALVKFMGLVIIAKIFHYDR